LKIVREAVVWPVGELRRASVNSFGYGGANAHTILEATDHLAPGRGGVKAKVYRDDSNCFANSFTNGSTNGHVNGYTNGTNSHSILSRRPFLLTFSAHNEQTLKSNIESLRNQVEKYDLLDVAYTLGCRRSKFSNRTYAVASRDTVLDSLNIEGLVISKAIGSRGLKLGFVFTGICSYGRRFCS